MARGQCGGHTGKDMAVGDRAAMLTGAIAAGLATLIAVSSQRKPQPSLARGNKRLAGQPMLTQPGIPLPLPRAVCFHGCSRPGHSWTAAAR